MANSVVPAALENVAEPDQIGVDIGLWSFDRCAHASLRGKMDDIAWPYLIEQLRHCRALGDVLMPDGMRRPWRWYDPELLAAMLSQFTPSQHDEVFGAGQQIVLVAPAGWIWFGLEDGVLARQDRPLLSVPK